jgi:integrase
MARPPQSKAAPGIYEKDHGFWLRYTYDGKQVRVRLGTNDPAEAIKRANEQRGRPPVDKKTGRVIQGKTPIERALEKYLAEKIKRPDFGELASKNTSQAVRNFASVMKITDANAVTSKHLADYYKKLSAPKSDKANKTPKEEENERVKKSEATAQTYTTRVGTFLRGIGLMVKTPEFSTEAPARNIVIPLATIAELLNTATDVDLKFILMAGFRAGMRRMEITMARPAWFDLDARRIHLPAKDPVSGFTSKSGRPRTIPLTKDFSEFIRASFPNWKTQKYCIRPEVAPGTWIYRFDFRKLFVAFAKKHCPELTPHAMRHSYTSHLANAGIGSAQLSSWTGDRIATLERHYLHLDADAKKADAAFSPPDKMEPDMVFGDPNAPDQGMPLPLDVIRKRRLEGE